MCLFSLASRKRAAEILEEEGEDDLEEEEDFSIRPASKRRRPYTPTSHSSPTGFLDDILGKEYSQVQHESEEEEGGVDGEDSGNGGETDAQEPEDSAQEPEDDAHEPVDSHDEHTEDPDEVS